MVKSASVASLNKGPRCRPTWSTLYELYLGSKSQRKNCVYLVQDVRVWDFIFQLPGDTNVRLRSIETGAWGPHNFNTQCLQNINLLEGRKEM